MRILRNVFLLACLLFVCSACTNANGRQGTIAGNNPTVAGSNQAVAKDNQAVAKDNHAVAKYNRAAVAKNNQAVYLVMRYSANADSVRKAIKLLGEAISIDSTYELAYNNQAKYLAMSGRVKEALAVVKRCGKNVGTTAVVVFTEAVLTDKLGNKAAAAPMYVKAAEMQAKSLSGKSGSDDYFNAAMYYGFAGNKKMMQAYADKAEMMKGVTQQQAEMMQSTVDTFDKDREVRNFWGSFF